MPCTETITSENYADFITRYYGTPAQLKETLGTDCVDFISSQYAVVYTPFSDLPTPGFLTLSYYTYSAIPKLYALLDQSAMEAAGIAKAARLPALSGDGAGVLIGFIDTGIDYENPCFQNPDGSTRILGIWDQTAAPRAVISGSESSASASKTVSSTLESPAPPDSASSRREVFFSPLYGVQYTREDIDTALRSENPRELVPARDDVGHGTFLASVAAGSPDEGQGFWGAAPKASVAMVKLKPAKQYLKDFYVIPRDALAYQENDIMMGVTYLYSLARQYSMPLVLCIGLGTTQGGHTGQLPLSGLLSEVSAFPGSAVVAAAGNETGYGTHYRGLSDYGEAEQDVELRVGERSGGFSMELWAQDIEIYRIGFLSPTGELIKPLPTATGDENSITFLLEQTEINVYYNLTTAAGSQVIFIRFRNPLPGIWHIRVMSALDFRGSFHLWLPIHSFLDDGTYFLKPDPDTTVTGPGNASGPVTVTAYDHRNGAIYIHASRGYSRSGQIKPEIAAPGVNVLGAALPPAAFTAKTGSSVAAAVTAGAAALFLKWGILDGNAPYMSTAAMKTLFIRGAKRNPELAYPNREFGYGTLDLYSAFLSLRI